MISAIPKTGSERSRGVALLTVLLVVALATLLPKRLGAIAGGEELGVLLMQVFFAVIGASERRAAS